MSPVAFAYYRRSAGNLDGDGEAKIASCVRESGLTLVATQTDPRGVILTAKGTNFSRMLVRLHAGEAGTLVIDELSSLSDDVIEQARLGPHPFALAVQYHPERDPLYQPLFDAFVERVLQDKS